MATQQIVNLTIKDMRSPIERLRDTLYGPRCPYCGQRDSQPSTHLARVHDKAGAA